MTRRILLAAVLAGCVAGAAWLAFATIGSGPTTTAKRTNGTCARTLLADWADGRIDRTYPIGCYRAAMRSLPTDLEMYSSAPEDIAGALRDRIVQSSARKSR